MKVNEIVEINVKGFKEIRFANEDVLNKLEKVAEKIKIILDDI